MFSPRLPWITGSGLLLVLLAGCSSSSSSFFVPPDASLSVVHASPGAPNVDVAVDGNLVLQDVPYGVSSAYLDIDAGNRVVSVFATGSTTPLLTRLIDAEDGTRYSLVVYDQPSSLKTLLLSDQADVDLGSDQAAVKVVHGSPVAGAVDVYVTTPGADLSSAMPSIANFQLGDQTPYLKLDAVDVQIRITPAGSLDVAYDSGTITLEDGKIWTLIALDATQEKAPVSLLLIDDRQPEDRVEITDARSAVRLFHAISDAPAVDLLAGGEIVNAGLPFNSAGTYELISAGSREILVRDSGSQGEVFRQTLDLPRTEELTFFALGSLTDPAEQNVLFLVDAPSQPGSGEALVRVLHGSVLAGTVDVYVTAPAADISGLDPTIADFELEQATDYLPLPAGSYEITVTAAGTKVPAIGPVPASVAEGDILTIVAVDPVDLMGSPSLTILSDGDPGE